jgi:thiol-disulfide isomerase/thioredoxin
MKKSIFLAIVLFLICIFSGAINWVFQFIVVGLCYFLSGVYLAYQTHKTNKKWLLFLLCLPFIILYSIISIHNTLSNNFYATMPIWIGAIFYGLLGYIVYQKGLRPKGIIVTGIVTAFLNFIFIHNWFAFALEKELEVQQFPEIALVDSQNNPYNIDADKVLVFDLWSTSCGVCIEKFPDYEKLSLKYANNPDVKFYTLNLPLRRDKTSGIDASEYVADYKFESLFASDKSAWKALQIQTVPHFIIVNKESKIVYKGRLHDKWYYFYNNIHNLIDANLN